jgi:thiol-disulfide isomerase/thioredoxin
MKNIVLFLAFVTFFSDFAGAQGYKIKVKVADLPTQEHLIGYYFADNQFVLDTVFSDEKGLAIFEGEEKLDGGMYFWVLPNKMHIDLIISDDQEFSVELDTTELYKNIKITGSTENTLFYNYQNFLQQQNEKYAILAQQKEAVGDNSDSAVIIQTEIENIQKIAENYWQKLAAENKGTFFATMLTAMNGDVDKHFNFGYFFNYIDFSDARLLRSPVIHKAVRIVLARNLNQEKDANFIMTELDSLFARAKANKEVYQYVVGYTLSFFNSFQRLGMNYVFAHIADNYILNGNSDWFDEATLASISERNEIMKASFVGQKAHDLQMENVEGEVKTLYDIDTDYTLLFFWSTGCGHCEAATEHITKFMKESNYASKFSVYAVYAKDNKNDWEDFIKKYETQSWTNVWDVEDKNMYHAYYYIVSTPILFLLNKNKEIMTIRAGDQPIELLMNEIRGNLH